jgi:hypothetical protein
MFTLMLLLRLGLLLPSDLWLFRGAGATLLPRGLLFVAWRGFFTIPDGFPAEDGSTVDTLLGGGEGFGIGFDFTLCLFLFFLTSSPLLPERIFRVVTFPIGEGDDDGIGGESGEGLGFRSVADPPSVVKIRSFPEVSISDVSLENGAVERSDSNFLFVQCWCVCVRGRGVRSVSLVSFESWCRLSSDAEPPRLSLLDMCITVTGGGWISET